MTDVAIEIRCTAWERQMIEKVAAISGDGPAEWALDAAVKRAQQIVDGLAERAANGGAA